MTQLWIKIQFFEALFLLICSLFNKSVDGQSKETTPKQFPMAQGFAKSDKKGPMTSYNDEPGSFGNMNAVLKTFNSSNLSTICVTGTFLLYTLPDYVVPQPALIRLISGKKSCIPAGIYQSLQSAMPLSAAVDEDPSLSLFTEPFFQGPAIPFKKNVREATGKVYGKIQSLILHGDKPYTIVSALTGRRYCLRPGGKGAKPSAKSICVKMFIPEWDNDNVILDAYLNCFGNITGIAVDDCRPSGGGKLEEFKIPKYNQPKHLPPKPKPKLKVQVQEPVVLPVEVADSTHNSTTLEADSFVEPPIPNYTSFRIPPKNVPIPFTKCNANSDILELLEMRMQSDLNSDYQVFYPKNKKFAWRTELLDSAVEIVMKLCPTGLFSHQYLQIMREFFIFLVEKVAWAKGQGKPAEKTFEWTTAAAILEACKHELDTENRVDFKQNNERALQSMGHIEASEVFDYRLEPFAAFSPVVETAWLLLNLVTSACNSQFHFRTNLIQNLTRVYQEMYLDLEGIKKEWQTPKEHYNYLPILFGGGIYSPIIHGLAICASTVYKVVPTLEVTPRPKGFPDMKRSDKEPEAAIYYGK